MRVRAVPMSLTYWHVIGDETQRMRRKQARIQIRHASTAVMKRVIVRYARVWVLNEDRRMRFKIEVLNSKSCKFQNRRKKQKYLVNF